MHSFITSLKERKAATLLIVSAWLSLGISYSAVYLYHIVLAFYLVCYLWQNRNRLPGKLSELKASIGILEAFLLFGFAWYFFMIFFAGSKSYAVKHLSWVLFGISLTFIMIRSIRTREDLRFVLQLCLGLLALEILISCAEILKLFRWPVSRLSEHVGLFGRVNDLAYITRIPQAKEYLSTSPSGFRWNPNNLATLMVIVFPFIFFNLKKYAASLFTILIFVVVVASGSRLNYLALIIETLVFVFFLKKDKILPLLLVVVIFLCLTTNFFQFRYGNSLKMNEIRTFSCKLLGIRSQDVAFEIKQPDESGFTRAELIDIGLNTFMEHKGWGIGGGNSRAVIEANKDERLHKIGYLHNFWLECLVEGGLIYALIYAAWYALMMIKTFMIFRRSRDQFIKSISIACFISLIGYILAAIGPSSVIYYFPMYLFYGFCIAFINLYSRKYENPAALGH